MALDKPKTVKANRELVEKARGLHYDVYGEIPDRQEVVNSALIKYVAGLQKTMDKKNARNGKA